MGKHETGPWFNFRTETYDERTPTTDEEAVNYISQDPSAQGLYRVRRAKGADVLEAINDVLLACVPEEH